MKNFTKLFFLFLLITSSSCLSRIEKEGYVFDNDVKKNLQKNITTKDEVMKIMGSPTFTSDLEDETWIYQAQESKYLLFFKPKIIKRNITVISFNANKIKDVKDYDLSNQTNLSFNDHFTEVKSHEKGAVKELFSNIGQIGAI